MSRLLRQQDQVQLANGHVVDYTIHFDRNSLQDSERIGDRLIALTSSGALLSFELPTVRWVKERIDTEWVTCLGRDEGNKVLAGLSDGRVCRVDPLTLGLTEVTKLPSEPRWVGWWKGDGKRPAGLVVVTRKTKPVNEGERHCNVPFSVVHDLATGKTFELEDEATAFLLDRSGRFWVGTDKGEWGGSVTRIELIKGTLDALKPPRARRSGGEADWEGVYGFVELGDGQVWAFGGTMHMGIASAVITRVDQAEPRRLFLGESPPFAGEPPEKGQATKRERPYLPITHIVEEQGKLRVFSYSDVFLTDKELKS
jgi:hypothetical protein